MRKSTANQRRMIMFERILKTGAINFIRNAWLGIAAIAVMVITLSIVLFSVIANATFANTIQQLTDRIDVSVYLKDTVTPEQRDKLIAEIKALPNTKSVRYLTKEEALEEFKQQNPEGSSLRAALAEIENPLWEIIRMKPNDPNKLDSIRAYLEKPENSELQDKPPSYSGDRKEAIDKISQTTQFFRQAGFVGVVVFTVVSMLIIFNTIRMAIFNRRDELTIMRLLGAGTSYIRGPFVVETIIYGIVAGILSVAICQTLFTIASSAFNATSLGLLDIGFAKNYFSKNYWLILTVQIAIGIVIGAASSMIATRRYLKFKAPK